jgi:hypothetical protein
MKYFSNRSLSLIKAIDGWMGKNIYR